MIIENIEGIIKVNSSIGIVGRLRVLHDIREAGLVDRADGVSASSELDHLCHIKPRACKASNVCRKVSLGLGNAECASDCGVDATAVERQQRAIAGADCHHSAERNHVSHWNSQKVKHSEMDNRQAIRAHLTHICLRILRKMLASRSLPLRCFLDVQSRNRWMRPGHQCLSRRRRWRNHGSQLCSTKWLALIAKGHRRIPHPLGRALSARSLESLVVERAGADASFESCGVITTAIDPEVFQLIQKSRL